jgi:GNAT superfamily N-acetyltransferase
LSDPVLDALAETARNRGLKLVRTPGKRGFGKVGLTDARGTPVFGMDATAPNGTPDDVEEFLRNLGAKDWGASLDVAIMPRRRKPKKAPREPANDTGLRPARLAPKRNSAPAPQLRAAKPADSARIGEMIGELGHPIGEKQVRRTLAALNKLGETPIVATLGKKVVGLVGLHRMVTIHRAAPVGRVPVLVVAEEERGHGIGRLLVEAAEQWCRTQGCELIEVTSNDRLTEAHAFYRHLGYERSSIRFFKKLQ